MFFELPLSLRLNRDNLGLQPLMERIHLCPEPLGSCTEWAVSHKDVAHLVIAATIVCSHARSQAKVPSRDEDPEWFASRPFGEFGLQTGQFQPFTIAMMMPDFVIAVALWWQKYGLTFVPHSRREPLLDPATAWRFRRDVNVDRVMPPKRRCGKPVDDAVRRLLARAWNETVGILPGWPARRLAEPAVKAAVDIAWEAFPVGLRRDLECYLRALTKIRKTRRGQRIRPLKEATIRTRQAEIQAAARMAVKVGVAIESLNSLAALLAPDVAEKVLNAYWERNGGNPKLYTIDLAARFRVVTNVDHNVHTIRDPKNHDRCPRRGRNCESRSRTMLSARALLAFTQLCGVKAPLTCKPISTVIFLTLIVFLFFCLEITDRCSGRNHRPS